MDPKLQPPTPGIHILFIVLLLHSYFTMSDPQICNNEDQSTLLTFASSVSSSLKPLNWSYATSCCKWEGVSCGASGRVTHLELPSRGLKGIISSSIRNLVSLTHLNLSNNNLHGPLGEDIVGLPNLRVLDLSLNRFFGPIPQDIGNLLYLEKLYLPTNNFSGPIPESLMKCTNLVDIILRDNYFEGDLSKLDLSRLVQLQKLDLANNSLKGNLPESIYSIKSLIAIRVALNNLSGEISPKIVGLKFLSFLSLTHNSFTNITKTLRILANCKNLTILFLGSNFHGESLPSDSNFLGSVGFPKLEFFSLDGCDLTGSFPEWLRNLKTLRALSLNDNKITDKLPHWLGTLPNLISLELSGNNLFGEIPTELCQLPTMVSALVDPNLNRFHVELPIFGETLNGLYNEYTNLWFYIVLAKNKLSGHIPLEIGKLERLQFLSLDNNHFDGHIPLSFSNLKNLEVLQLSNNNLTGPIPTTLENLHFLSDLNVSYNDLQGQIPTGGQFTSFDESSFEGNPSLCGEPMRHPCSSTGRPKAKNEPLKVEVDTKDWFLDGFFVGFSSAFSGILVIVASYVGLIYCKTYRLLSSRRG